jgi:glutamine---fructose-6-phosphate transaminase (isomerizing)
LIRKRGTDKKEPLKQQESSVPAVCRISTKISRNARERICIVCGIAGFLSNWRWQEKADLTWLNALLANFEAYATSGKWEDLSGPLKELVDAFDRLMSFGLHLELAERSESLVKLKRISEILGRASDRLTIFMTEHGRSDFLEQLAEDTRDCRWQIEEEVIGNVIRTTRLLPDNSPSASNRSRHFVAWAIELVMESLDRLEVRGRDSAGISIQLTLPSQDVPTESLVTHRSVVCHRPEGSDTIVEKRSFSLNSTGGLPVHTFVYKVANLVGRLGDNTGALRNAIRHDCVLWEIASLTDHVNIIAHTRWASNGIISLANCHPVNGELCGREHSSTIQDREAEFVLNGDVDNYRTLVRETVKAQGYEIEPTVTTDAKILPVYFRLGTDASQPIEDRFAGLMNDCQGSLAVLMQHPAFPFSLFLGQKGSGQSLFIGRLNDGFTLASEVYGLATRTRRSYALNGTERGGTQVTLSASADGREDMTGRFLEDRGSFEIEGEPIYIHSRDIYRGSYDYYFEKEINEAPSSVRKTLKGKFRKIRGTIDFAMNGTSAFSALLGRVRDANQPPVRRILCIGQGTASVAAMGVAHLIERALARSRIVVGWQKASEMSGFLSEDSLDDMLIIAISQSGTTTDTNRTVDVAGSQGAWVHAIVNRRNSPLVAKSHSHLYTSDGRDVEMAVASTKAFYSQITAGKLTALLLAREFECLTDEEIRQEIEELETLPGAIEWVLDQRQALKESAETYGPSSRNWAVVGNGPNKIAADEIRIKLSELCYKSIPCDFTEDKKHIDLSTEPLTIVVANDLPESIVQDTVKEVAIFRAHNGKPLVFCNRGEKRFGHHSHSVIELPPIGGGLGFVLATVAGHLWGFYAAKAIDARVEGLRNCRAYMAKVLENPLTWSAETARSTFVEILRMISRGEMNAALPASTAASLALYLNDLTAEADSPEQVRETVQEGIAILNRAVEEMTRPIDTIRHQAKTVTVGISRPKEILPPVLLVALEKLSVTAAQIKEQDRRILRTVSPLISDAEGGLLYKIVRVVDGAPVGVAGETPWIQVLRRFGSSDTKGSRYDEPKPAGGSKRTALRLERSIFASGPSARENMAIIPLFDEERGDCPGIVLLHLRFAPQASAQQKLGVLRGLGNRYHDFVERLEEVSDSLTPEEAIEKVSPRDLVLAPVERLVGEGR